MIMRVNVNGSVISDCVERCGATLEETKLFFDNRIDFLRVSRFSRDKYSGVACHLLGRVVLKGLQRKYFKVIKSIHESVRDCL